MLRLCQVSLKLNSSPGAEELEAVGCGLNVRDAVMEKIFVVDSSSGEGCGEGAGRGGASPSSSEKEEGEVGEAGEGERYKFWVRVDIVRVAD